MPKASVSRTYPGSSDRVWEATKQALAHIGASIAAENRAAGSIRAYVRLSVWSWGEALEVSVKPSQEAENEVTVESRSRFPLTLIDWGKNNRNVIAILNELDVSMSPSSSRSGQRQTVEDTETALRRLAKMRDEGLITGEEYEEKRRALVEKL